MIESTIYKKKLVDLLAQGLPGERAHDEMMPYIRMGAEEARAKKQPRESAVMLLLFEEHNDLFGVFIERAQGGVHSGQIALPGGKKEPNDPQLLFTALRETAEEIGIRSEQYEIVGELSEVYIPPSNFVAKPFVGWLPGRPHFAKQDLEVVDILCLSLSKLLKRDNLQRKVTRLPVYDVDVEIPYFGIDHRYIWGATALMINEFRWIFSQVYAQIHGQDL